MLNYIHGELYRAAHNKAFGGTVALLAGLGIFFHMVLRGIAADTPSFPYATTSYSYSVLVSSPDLFRAAAFLMASLLYESDRRNGIDKNSLAFGLSRTGIFLGKCIAGAVACTVAMVVVLAAYTGAAMLLSQSGPVLLSDLLQEVAAVFPASVASMILCVALLMLFEKGVAGAFVWVFLLFVLPRLIVMLGAALQSEAVMRLAMWMPQNLFATGMEVNMSQCITIWSTPQGMLRCILSGTGCCVLFTLFGIVALRKKDF